MTMAPGALLDLPIFQPGSQGYTCTKQCGARCCKYYSLQIETPKNDGDWDDVRWYLMHEHTNVYKYGGAWYLLVNARCRHLQPNNLCGIYDRRPKTCADYDPSDCEFTGEVPYQEYFRDDAELDAWLAKRKLARAETRTRRTAAKRAPVTRRKAPAAKRAPVAKRKAPAAKRARAAQSTRRWAR